MKDPFIQITDNNYKTSREKSSSLCALHPLHALRYFNFNFCIEQISIVDKVWMETRCTSVALQTLF